jgi:hypothetical protein
MLPWGLCNPKSVSTFASLTNNLKTIDMTSQEFYQTHFVTSMTDALSPIIGAEMARWFFTKIFQKMEEQGKDIEKTLNTLTYRAESGRIADMIFWAIGSTSDSVNEWDYWVLMERILEEHFTGTKLNKG